ncbi:MAG: PVC-type heme-binding CxxCH protein [Planctomycetota bacterium]|nr:PVC-type heme-binding CxxCH protein [Planctomycetota bacterium]
MKNAICLLILFLLVHPLVSQDANRLTYLDEFCDSYYPALGSARLTTPQWVGEPGVEAVITLGIDDMRDPAHYEAYLRPILDRLKKIDGRAPVSILTCSVDVQHPRLATWLEEGLSIECHTIDHPCPCLNGGDFDRAKSTYDRCVDMMFSIKGNRPVAFRFPCMDSLNTPSPRAFAEIVNRKTDAGNFLQISTSVTNLFTPADPVIQSVFRSTDGKNPELDRFKKYVPFPSFVNQIRDYPYPYLIGNQCWEFPCTIPDDWQGQNLHRPHNPKTVEDLKAAIDATFLKKGVANIIFHPHAWIRAEQMVEVIDYAEKKYGKRIKFLNFRECLERINRNLLAGTPVRHPVSGENNGVRLLDINGDGYLDVLIGNEEKKIIRVWDPKAGSWKTGRHPFLVEDLRFGVHNGKTVLLHDLEEGVFERYDFPPGEFQPVSVTRLRLPASASAENIRLRDLNNDGKTEILVAGPEHQAIYPLVSRANGQKQVQPTGRFPHPLVDARGRDNGLRFVDINEDQLQDIVISNDDVSQVLLASEKEPGFQPIEPATEIPRIVNGGKNGGVWFANGHLWVQNEHTNRLPDGVDRRSFHQILARTDPKPLSAKASLKSFQLPSGFRIELMAAEPLVMDPIALEWGVDGKLWVVEMADYPLGLDDRGQPGGRVRYLEDTDQDGVYDKSTLFVDKIPFPTGVLPINIDPDRPGCLISAAPYVVQVRKKSDWKEVLADPENILLQGFAEGNQQHRFNGFSAGLDNWIYLANGDSGGTVVAPGTDRSLNINGRDLRIRLKPKLAMEALTGQTQFGRHRDSWGNWFGCANPLPLRHYLLPDYYLKRNPHYQYPSPRRDIATAGNTRIYPISRVLSHWSGYRPPAPGQPHRFTSACSTDIYRDQLYGSDFFHNSFTCEPVHNLVHRRILKKEGVSYSSSRAASESDSEFLASRDSWFRPTTVKAGPEGALWITDMYRLVIEHPEWIDDQREKELFLRAGHDRGRIYRIVPDHPEAAPLPVISRPAPATVKVDGQLTTEFTDYLISMLMPQSRWQNETAQRLLVQAGENVQDRRIGEKLQPLLTAPQPHVRLNALCVLDGRNEIQPAHLIRAFADKQAGIRKNAIRIAERFLKKEAADRILSGLKSRLADPDLQVRLQLAFSLGYSSQPAAAALLAQLGNENHQEAAILAAVISSLNRFNISEVVRQASLGPANADFLLTLLEQASALGHPELARQSLVQLFGRAQPHQASTRQLEMIVQVYQSLAGGKPGTDDPLPGLSRKFAAAVNSAIDEESSQRRRTAAVRLMAASPWLPTGEKVKFLETKIDPRVDIRLQRIAVAELAKIESDSVAQLLMAKWRLVTPEIRSAFFATLVQRTKWSQMFLKSIAKGDILAAEISGLQKNQLLSHPEPQVAQLARTVFHSNSSTPRAKLAEQLVADFSARKDRPDLANGKRLFEKHCSRCHRLEEIGNQVGPDLLTIKDRSMAVFVNGIVQPNLAVEDKYRSYVVALDDGREIVGMIQSETSGQIRLATVEGKSIDLLRTSIERMKSTGKSLMPEGLEQEFQQDQMFHLVSYLLTTIENSGPGMKRKSFAGNWPEQVKPSDGNLLRMSATNCEIYGPQLVFESRYQNLGYWGHVDDMARWKVTVGKKGRYNLFLHFSCPDANAGNPFQFRMAGQILRGKVTATGTWDDYQRIRIGSLELDAGEATATFSAEALPNGFLMDFKSLELVPAE